MNECQRCGACCVCLVDIDTYCMLREGERDQIDADFAEKHLIKQGEGWEIETKWVEVTAGPLEGLRLNVCAALGGDVLNHVSCLIYENRPSVCSCFAPGSLECELAQKDLDDAVFTAEE